MNGPSVHSIGAESYYFSKLWQHWSDKCSDGKITEEQMENKIDRVEEMSVRQRKAAWDRIRREKSGVRNEGV